jgi:folate-dependent phosphoribosylglycinamide formyltransferase PurN
VLVSGRPPGGPIPTIWLGMRCDFTRAAIEGARDVGALDVAFVVLPRGPKPLGAGWPAPPFDRWLREIGAVTVEVDRLAGNDFDAVVETIRKRGIALGVGACLPWKVPAALRDALPGGVLNIHPSLLPALRGPEPVFHAYRNGLAETGVTVHQMDAGWDSGPVLARERVPIPDAGRAEAFEASLARRGGRMLAEAAPGWLTGTVSAASQDDSKASWAPIPSERDRVIPETLTVAQATRFLAACGPLLARDVTGALVPVTGPIAAEPRGSGDDGGTPDAVRVRVRDGELWLRRGGSGG